MAQNALRPKILIDYGRMNEPLRVPISDLIQNPQAQTIITTDAVAGLTVLTVKDITNIHVNNILFVGQEGNQGSEIVKTHASTAPSGSTITLAAATAQPHSASTKLRLIPYNQIEFSYASTSTGSKTVLVTTPISAGLFQTIYLVSTYSAGFYFARWKDSVNTVYSSYSDATPVAGYTKLMARSIIDSALEDINKAGSNRSDALSDSYAFQQINNCQSEVLREMKRWSFMQSFGQVLTPSTVGAIRVALPTNCDDQNTNSSIWNFRLGTLPNMQWIDKAKYDELTYNMAQTTAKSSAAAQATTVVLADSSDFADSGTFYNRTNGNAIDYISNDRTTGTLTLGSNSVVGHLITPISAGVEIYQNPTFGLPQYWTSYGGFAWHWPLTSATYKNKNYYMDYYLAQTQINNDTDMIVLPDPTIVQYYLEWKFLKKLNNGIENGGSMGAKANYENRKNILKVKDNPNRTFRLKPRLNRINENAYSDSKRDRLAGFPDA